MGSLDKINALKLITQLSVAVKGMAFYPTSHPAISRPLQELHKLLENAFCDGGPVSWGHVDGIMFFNEHLFISPSTAVADLTNRMIESEIGRITMRSMPAFMELETFVKLFSVKGVKLEARIAQMAAAGVINIKLSPVGVENEAEVQDDAEDVEPDGDHIETYNRALSAIRTLCRDIERGRIPNSASLIKVVDRMVGITMQEPCALLGLTMIKDYDNYTFNHCVNVGILAMALGASLGMDAISVRDLGIAGQLHDIGKTMIAKEILNKPGRLSSAEFDEMKLHPELGSKIIREMEGLAPHISAVVLGHHLHFNRSGYPKWASTLPFNRMIDIIAVADTYDAITTLRVYQHPVNPRAALNEMQSLKNTLLDGTIVDSFAGMMGNYPVGTMVRLDTNEVAIVYRPNPLDEDAPLVRILINPAGKKQLVPKTQALVLEDGSCYAKIVAVVDPLLKNIDIGEMVASGIH